MKCVNPTPRNGNPDERPDLPDSMPSPPINTCDDWEGCGRGPRPLASLGNIFWVNRAARERLAKQRQGEDTQYTHHWTVKDLRYARTPTIAKNA